MSEWGQACNIEKNRYNKIDGFEELPNYLEGIHYLDEAKLLLYLKAYNIQDTIKG